jgi:hypothetical protein
LGQGRERKKLYQSYNYTIVQEIRNNKGELISKRVIKGTKKEKEVKDTIQKFLIQHEDNE